MTAEDAPDADLVRRSLAGDHAAFAVLARRYGPALTRTVRALGVREAEVEDVIQNAFLGAWRSLADYDPTRPFLGWATTLTVNKARDWARRRKVRRAWFEGAPLDGPAAMAIADPAHAPEMFERREALRRIQAAVEHLPAPLQTAFVLVMATGLTHAEAGLALKISARTVEARVAKARRLLGERLGRP